MKNINYKMKYLNRVIYSSKRNVRELQLSRIILASTKRTSNITKIKLIYIFCEKPVSKSVRS